jgi:hypothetical protein
MKRQSRQAKPTPLRDNSSDQEMEEAPCSQVSLDQQAELDKKQEKAQL